MSWWIARLERTVSGDVPASPDDVRDSYVDLENLPRVHPLVVSVKELSRDELADGYRQTYRVVDRLRWGPLTFRTAYVVTWFVPEDGDVETEAVQSPGVRIRGTVAFTATDGGTCVTERLRIEAPRPLAGYTARQAVRAHTRMLAALRGQFVSA